LSDIHLFEVKGFIRQNRGFTEFELFLMQAAFNIGDTVREKSQFTSVKPEKGIVIDRYEFGGDFRYIVKFDSGLERVLFERELVLDPNANTLREHDT